MLKLKIDCIADTHGAQPALAGGDILVIAGDISYQGEPRELAAFNAWVSKQNYEAKVLIAGNHDWLFERNPGLAKSLIPGVTHYLQDPDETAEGLERTKIWLEPLNPAYGPINIDPKDNDAVRVVAEFKDVLE